MLDAVGLFLVGNAALKFCVMLSTQRRRPPHARLVGRVTQLNIHPIKSMRALPQHEALVTPRGLASHHGYSDREFMLVDADGSPINQKTFPAMATVGMRVDSGHLELTAPGQPPLRLPLNPDSSPHNTIWAWKGSIEALDCGDGPARWLSQCLGAPGLRLLYSGPGMQKRSVQQHGKTDIHRQARPDDQMSFSGSTAFLLTNEVSLTDLNSRLDNKVDMRNFRANIVVGGSKPYEEDDWSEVYIGDDVKFTNLLPCGRCVITTVDPDTGAKYPHSDPLRTLLTYRKVDARLPSKAMFGVYLLLDRAGPVTLGDPVYVVDKPN